MTDLREATSSREEHTDPLPGLRRWRPAWVFAVAVVLVVATIGVVALLAGGSGVPDIGEEPTVSTPTSLSPPTTQPAPTTTTIPAPTTTLPAPVVLGPPVVDTYINELTFDGSGDAWATGWVSGLSIDLFRLQDGVWSTVALPADFDLSGALHPAPDGSVWVAGEGGLARYHEGDWTVYAAPETFEFNGDLIYAGNYCGTLTIDTTGGVWAICPDILMRLDQGELVPVEQFGEIGGGWWLLAGPDGAVYNTGYEDLLHFDGSEWSTHECPAPDPWARCSQLLGVDADGNVWAALGSYGLDGLVRFDGTSLEPELILGEATGVTDMAVANDGSLWFAVPDDEDFAYYLTPEKLAQQQAGLFRFDGTSWRRYTTDDGLNSNSVVHVEVAADGTMLVGTAIRHVEVGADGTPSGGNIGGGIDVYDPVLDRFIPLGGES